MRYELRNLVLANLAVLATSFLAFLQNPLTGYAIVGVVVLTDLVLFIQFLGKRVRRRRSGSPRPLPTAEPAYTIELLRERCIGHGNCRALAPAAFALDAENKVVLLDPRADPVAVRDAARACPVDAIFLYDATGRQVYPDPHRPWQKKRVRPAS